MAAKENIDLNGNGPGTDSFDSADPNFSTNGQYDPSKASTNGHVASASGVVDLGNMTIKGGIYLGPTASYVTNTGQVSGEIYHEAAVQFPEVVEPSVAWLAPPTSGGIHNFATPQSNGYYLINDNKDIHVQPGVKVTIKLSVTIFSPTNVYILGGQTNPATLIIYQVSGTGDLCRNITVQSGNATNFIYYGRSGVTNILLNGSNTTTGIIYAPQATVLVNGGGESNGFVGSLIARSVTINGHYPLHFDENLNRVAPFPPWITDQPQDQNVAVGQNVTFAVAATGPGPITYHWQFNSSDVPGATNSSLLLTNVQPIDAGDYLVVLANAYGSVTSSPAALLVSSPGGSLDSPALGIDGSFQFNVYGLNGENYALEGSTDLINWISLATNVAPFLFVETNSGVLPQRFYRSVYLP